MAELNKGSRFVHIRKSGTGYGRAQQPNQRYVPALFEVTYSEKRKVYYAKLIESESKYGYYATKPDEKVYIVKKAEKWAESLGVEFIPGWHNIVHNQEIQVSDTNVKTKKATENKFYHLNKRTQSMIFRDMVMERGKIEKDNANYDIGLQILEKYGNAFLEKEDVSHFIVEPHPKWKHQNVLYVVAKNGDKHILSYKR